MKNRKFILINIISCFFLGEVSAQYLPPSYYSVSKYNTIDLAYIKCTYKLSSIKDTLHTKNTSIDKQILLIGKKKSKYYSQHVLDYNKKMDVYIAKTGANGISGNPEKGAYGYEVFNDFENKKLTVTYNAVLLGNYYFSLYPDSLTDLSWTLGNEKKMILNYACQKATTHFRNREYTAWFTTEIPIPEGPWKLKGLPGLILQVSDFQNYFNFECIGIELLKTMEPIPFYPFKYRQVTREEYDKQEKRYHNNADAYERALGGKTLIVDADGSFKETKTSVCKYPYNPIEK